MFISFPTNSKFFVPPLANQPPPRTAGAVGIMPLLFFFFCGTLRGLGEALSPPYKITPYPINLLHHRRPRPGFALAILVTG